MPQSSGTVLRASEKEAIVEVNADSRGIKRDATTCITQLAHGQE